MIVRSASNGNNEWLYAFMLIVLFAILYMCFA